MSKNSHWVSCWRLFLVLVSNNQTHSLGKFISHRMSFQSKDQLEIDSIFYFTLEGVKEIWVENYLFKNVKYRSPTYKFYEKDQSKNFPTDHFFRPDSFRNFKQAQVWICSVSKAWLTTDLRNLIWTWSFLFILLLHLKNR